MQTEVIKLHLRSIFIILISGFSLFLGSGCVQERVATHQERAKALQNMGISFVREGNLREGLARLLEADELDPDNPDLKHELAYVLMDLGEYDRSLYYFQESLRLRPDTPIVHNNLGTLYLRMQQWDQAIIHFQKALDNLLYKTPDIAYNNIGLAYYGKGEYTKAITNYLKAIKAFPGYAACHTNLGLAYETVDRWDNAVESYQKAIQYEPGNPVPYIRMANLYHSLKLKDKAVAILKEFLGLVKDGPDADTARKMLEKYDTE